MAETVKSRAEQKAATRVRIVSGAKTCFDVMGYEGATIRAIAAEALLSTGAIFASFVDKAGLYQAVYGHAPVTPEQGLALKIEVERLREELTELRSDLLQRGEYAA